MTQLTREDVLKLARLARIDLTGDEVDEFSKEFSAIIQYVEKLQSVDVHGLEPTSQVTGLKNVMRKDEVIDYGYPAAQRYNPLRLSRTPDKSDNNRLI